MRDPSKLKEVKAFSPDDKFPVTRALGGGAAVPVLSHPSTEVVSMGFGIRGNWGEKQVLPLSSWAILGVSYSL